MMLGEGDHIESTYFAHECGQNVGDVAPRPAFAFVRLTTAGMDTYRTTR
ncbi:MAG: hypothetical protein JWQ24_5637 [Tardiphaga sp.]|nr:hypothetical protein [Tardiphaga sp.]